MTIAHPITVFVPALSPPPLQPEDAELFSPFGGGGVDPATPVSVAPARTQTTLSELSSLIANATLLLTPPRVRRRPPVRQFFLVDRLFVYLLVSLGACAPRPPRKRRTRSRCAVRAAPGRT
jgi:hypothetical protein